MSLSPPLPITIILPTSAKCSSTRLLLFLQASGVYPPCFVGCSREKAFLPRNLGNAYKISLYRKSSFGNRCVSPAFFRCYKFNLLYREHFFTPLSGIRITWSHKFRKGICTLCLLQCPPYGGHLQCIRSEKRSAKKLQYFFTIKFQYSLLKTSRVQSPCCLLQPW